MRDVMLLRIYLKSCLLAMGVSINAIAQTPAAEVPGIPQLVISATRVAQDGFNLPMAIDRID